MENAFKVFGTNLRRIRLEKGLTQTALSKITGITINSFSSWETFRQYPHEYAAKKVADALGVTLEEMMKPTEEKK